MYPKIALGFPMMVTTIAIAEKMLFHANHAEHSFPNQPELFDPVKVHNDEMINKWLNPKKVLATI